jgi:hypothetical protein
MHPGPGPRLGPYEIQAAIDRLARFERKAQLLA